MSMIPNTQPLWAEFREECEVRGEKKYLWRHHRIIAWTEEGSPMIAGENGLWCPVDDKEFNGITEDCSEHCKPAVGVIPGGGWRVKYRSKNKYDLDTEYVIPVLYWTIAADGENTAWCQFETDGSRACPADELVWYREFIELIQPKEEENELTLQP